MKETYTYKDGYIRHDGIAVPAEVAVSALNTKDAEIAELVEYLQMYLDATTDEDETGFLPVREDVEELINKYKKEG